MTTKTRQSPASRGRTAPKPPSRAGGTPPPGTGLDARARRLLARFEKERGFSREWHKHLVRHDPDFFERYIEFSAHMYQRGALPPKYKEIVLMALDAACTHQHASGTKVHMQNALRYGASVAEVVEALELCTLIGIHSCTLGMPLLAEVLAESPVTPVAQLSSGRRSARGARSDRVRGTASDSAR